ncbi:MAG: uroporphyrinogen decarboxylase [Psittacicella sp.]
MYELKNRAYIDAALNKNTDYTPVWMMRQAGRYLPEYRELRSKAKNFVELYKNVELSTEITLQPIRRFPLDAAIVFSDILTIPEAMGMDLEFVSGKGPVIHNPINSLVDIDNLKTDTLDQNLSFLGEIIENVQSNLQGEVPLIGFSGSPFTIASYMIEGGSTRNFLKIKQMMFKDPLILHALLQKNTESVVNYLKLQLKAGVNSLMIFDSWGGCLSPSDYKEFSLNYMAFIIKEINLFKKEINSSAPITLFTKGGGLWLEDIAKANPNVIGLDWTIDMGVARNIIDSSIAIQGNMDPSILYGSFDKIESSVEDILAKYGSKAGHIFNLGHGIDKDTPIENVEFFINKVHELSKKYHNK